MVPVQQTRFGTNGNCFQACVASLLGQQLDDVPDFCNESADWWESLQMWLLRRGHSAIQIRLSPQCMISSHGCPCIVFGISTRGVAHCVVGETDGSGFKLLFDPHPDGSFLNGQPSHALFIIPLHMRLL